MDGFFTSFSAVALIFLMAASGYIFAAVGWAKKEHKELLVKLIVNLAIPCMCITNMLETFDADLLASSLSLLIVPLSAVLVTATLSVLLAKLLKISRRRFGGFAVMCGLSNSLFIGFPLCTELLGQEAAPYVIFYYMINTFVFWTLGSTLLYQSGNSTKKAHIRSILRSILNPPLVVLILAAILAMLRVTLPHIIMRFCEYTGALVSPLALFFVGLVMRDLGVKFKFRDMGRDMIIILLMRFLVSPLITLTFCELFNVTGIPRGVFIIESAMPVMIQSVVVSTAANADDAYTSVGMSITTMACFLTVPAIMTFIV